MELNVDIICSETGEVIREGLLLAVAHIYIAKRNGKIVKDEVDQYQVDDIDGGGQIEIPEVVKDQKDYHDRMEKASKFWNYQAKAFVDACGTLDK